MQDDLSRQRFAVFYQEQFPLVVNYLLKFGADRAEAEDAVQSAMELLLRRADDVRSPAAWVRVVARNVWMRAMRRQAMAIPAGVAAEQVEPGAVRYASNLDPADVMRRVDEQQDAARMIRLLPRTQREVLAMVINGYRPAEIAEIMGKNSAAVRSNLTLARRRLGRLLAERHGMQLDLEPAA
ncbi:RNA polymerase sigma factor [Dactylosporangium sp. NPDC005555]|uniref:RNA polymerase sigma factor n=1 Tax=Dactylosporangium sp. NPDC005555 TaxID=3154889 RepID=UPI0033B81B5D